MKKALVLDIDGTLTNSKKEITPATKKAIQNLMEQGHQVILASGRPTPGMRKYERALEMDRYGGYLISFNGAKIVDCSTGEIICQKTLPLELVPQLYRFARENGCGLVTHREHDAISAFPPDEYVTMETSFNDLPVRTVEDFSAFVDFDINKCLMTAPPDVAQDLEEKLREQCGAQASIYRSEPYFIEIMPKGVDKGTSLGQFLPVIGVDRQNTVCCGDGFNDISMIRYAGVGVAMGNAQQVVKDAADYVAPANDEDGLVQVIEKFF